MENLADGPNSDAMEVKNNKRKRGRCRSRKRSKEAPVEEQKVTEASEIVNEEKVTEASEIVNEEKPQLKKRKSRRKKRKPEKVEIGEIKKEGLDLNETGSTGLQLVVIADEVVVRYVRVRGRSRKRRKEAAVEEKKITEALEIVNKEKPQLKKRKSGQQKRKPKKVQIGESEEEWLDHNETGSIGLQPVVITDESTVRKHEETSLKVCAEGIRCYATEDDIRSYFEGFGNITSFDCMTFSDSEKFRGIATIIYKTETAAKRALALDGSKLGGLYLKIQHYKSATSDIFPSFSPSVVDGYNSIYVGNLSLDTTEDDLWKLFADCAIASIRFSEDFTGAFKGYAYVDFADGFSLHMALKLDQTIIHGRPVSISCAISMNATGTNLIPLLKDNEDRGKKEHTTTLEAIPNDSEVDKVNVGVVKNQVTSSGTNDVCSKIQRQTCYNCGDCGHLPSACPKKLAANLTIPAQMIVSSEKKGTETMLIPLPKDNQEYRWKKGSAPISKKRWRLCYECGERGHASPSCPKKLAADPTNPDNCGKKRKFTKFEVTPRYDEIDRCNVSLVVENQVTSRGTNAHSSMIWKQCYECREWGHLASSCPNKLAFGSKYPDNHDDRGKGKLTIFEATPRDNDVDQSNVSVFENQVTSSGTNALSSKIWKRTCYKCGERGHLSSSCPKEVAVYSTNPVGKEFLRSNSGVFVENQVTSSGTNSFTSKIWKRTCFNCKERGHLMSCCPKKLAANSTNPVTAGNLLPISWDGCTSSVDSMPVVTTSAQIPVKSTLVRWLLPPSPWIKLNTDGAFDKNMGVASAGGLIRDHFGELQLAFCMPLKAITSFDAELQALLYGLFLARQFNRPIWIETDALEVVRLLDTDRVGAWNIQQTLISIRALMAQTETWVTHIFREGNQPADYMAAMGMGSQALHLVYPHSAPKDFLELVRMDRIGHPSFRVKH